jgi:hypothetical protein
LSQIDPSGMFGISPGGSQLGGIGGLTSFSLNGQTNEQTQAQPQKPQQPLQPAVDLRKDETISAAIAKINMGAKPLPQGQTPVLTNIRTVVGNTYNMVNGGFIDAYGNEAGNFTGAVRPVAYIPLDQSGNIIEANGIALQETVKLIEGEKPGTTDHLTPTPPGGVYLDIQSIKATSSRSVIRQMVWIGQFSSTPNTPATSLFSVGVNEITKDAKAGTIAVKLGETKKRR